MDIHAVMYDFGHMTAVPCLIIRNERVRQETQGGTAAGTAKDAKRGCGCGGKRQKGWDKMGYEMTGRIRYSDLDENGFLSADSAAAYFQDCSTFHDEDCGLGLRYWEKRGAFWAITGWKFLFFEMPYHGARVTIRTDATGFRAYTGIRTFGMRGEDGKLLAAGHTRWALLARPEGVPTKIAPEEVAAYGVSEGLPIPVENGRIAIPAISGEGIVMTEMFLDWNHHVNNIQLLRMALSYLPEGFSPRVVRAAYHRQVLRGAVLYPAFVTDDKVMSGGLVDEKGEAYCFFEFRKEMTEEEAAIGRL